MHKGISADEQARRQVILADIQKRLQEDGTRCARAYPERARQFMPFAALRGYSEMVRCAEEEMERLEHPELLEEDLWYLSGELYTAGLVEHPTTP